MPIKQLLTLITLSISILSLSQAEDSLYTDINKEDTIILESSRKKKKAPYMKRIGRWSWIPGGGQVVNKKYHKAPFYAAGIGFLGYSYWQKHREYRTLNANLNNLFDSDPNTINTSGIDSVFIPERLKELNTQRGLLLFATGIAWGLSMADANLDAQRKLKPEEDHRPKRSAFYSALLPGLGQAFNKKYWKIPMIYGAAYYLLYSYNGYSNLFQGYNTSYIQKINNIPLTNTLHDQASSTTLNQLAEKYRKKRERMIIYSFLLYAANIIDASVDSHLKDFSISDSIDIALTPLQANNQYFMGMSMGLKF